MDLLASAAPNAAPVVNASVNACMNVGVEAHVRLQIERLRVGDYAGAYSLNSADNQARLGDVATFEGIVKGNASFAALADSANACGNGTNVSLYSAMVGFDGKLKCRVGKCMKENRQKR